MLSLARHCCGRVIQRPILSSVAPKLLIRNEPKIRFNSAWFKQPTCNSNKNILLRANTTITLNQTVSASSKSKRTVGYWLLGCSGMVFVAVVLGGVTRLTESGLSMVTWKLLGENLPKSQEEWEAEFKKYQEFPEYKILNNKMTLSEFKRIWYMEYAHRTWGRCIGAAFLLPATYFWATGKFARKMKPRIIFFGSLIAIQGLLGWYMVRSGLEDRFKEPSDVPRVSQYRLAAHLTVAIVLYGTMLRSALNHLVPVSKLPENVTKEALIGAKRFFKMAHATKGLIYLTAISGAFVAGLDAGLVYNSFPKMGDKWVPDDAFALSPLRKNFTENPTLVQLDHRVLGIAALCMASATCILSKKRVLPHKAYMAANVLAAMAWLQVGLGITALLTYVPVDIAATHQSGSLALMATAIWLTHELRKIPK